MGGGELFNCAVTKKNYGKVFFPLVWNFDHENLAIIIWWYQAKKIQYLDISLLAAGPLISYSALKIWTVSNIKNPQERNMRTAGYRLSMYEAGVLGSLWPFLSRRPQIKALCGEDICCFMLIPC